MKNNLAVLSLAVLGLVGAGSAAEAALSWNLGAAVFDVPAAVKPSVRYRAFVNNNASNSGTYVGQHDLGTSSNRTAQTANGYYSTSAVFTFSFDGNQTVTSTYGGKPTISKVLPGGDPGALNAFQMTMRNSGQSGIVYVDNLTVNGDNIGNFSQNGFQDYTIYGADFSAGFTVTRTLRLPDGFSNYAGGESSKLQFIAGYGDDYQIDSVPEPSSVALLTLILGVAGVGALRKRRSAR